MKLQGRKVYLATLEKEDCKVIYESFEYDFNQMTEPLYIGHSISKYEKWFDEIQSDQSVKHIRLGIFTLDNQVIGDVALQDIDWKNRSCSLGIGIAKIENRKNGYGSEAIALILDHGFNHVGIERIAANTLMQNKSAQRVLEKHGFILEGTERKAVYFAGKKWDRLNYALLKEEYPLIKT